MSCRTMVLMRYAMSETNTEHKKYEPNNSFIKRLKCVYNKFKKFKLF